MSDVTTDGVRVQVRSVFIPERSDPKRSYWFFAYQVRIDNVGDAPVQLMARHWVITDARGHEEHVKGPGVVGEQPRLMPGQGHTYSSACPLPTSMGSMRGTYQMVRDDGTTFDAQVAPFLLADPLSLN